jgi:FixJ family two-component response regulator
MQGRLLPPDGTNVVYVVDDEPDMCSAIGRVLEDLHVEVRGFESAEAFLAALDPAEGDARCLLLDIALPGVDGLTLHRMLQEQGLELPVVFITGFADVATAVRAMHAGAFDLIQKPMDDAVLRDRVVRALNADLRHRTQLSRREIVQSRLATLSSRETEVLEHILNGLNHKQMADQMEIAIKTLLKHRAQVLRKFEVRSEVELLLLMTDAGLATNSRPAEQREPASRS